MGAGDTRMCPFIQPPDKLTASWLASVLETGVVSLSAHANATVNSSITQLQVTYAPGAAALTEHMLLKTNRENTGQNEVQFYRLAAGMDLLMLPRCFAAEHDPGSGLSYVLLEDISSTHVPPISVEQLKAGEGAPSAARLDGMIDALSSFHAAFWEHPSFGTVVDTSEMRWWYRDAVFHARHVQRRRVEWNKFLSMFGQEIRPGWRGLGVSILEVMPRLFETRIRPRLDRMRALTMSQGDCYLTQFLVPKQEEGDPYLVDFQDASVNFPAYDLVYMLATFWTREQRAQHEERLLRRYLQGLQEREVTYNWQQLREDYRLCLAYMFFDPVWNATAGSSPEYWWKKISCLAAACEDWDVAGLV